MTAPLPTPEGETGWFAPALAGACAYYFSALVVLLGVEFGNDVLRPAAHPDQGPADLASACVQFDGHHYHEIAERGYSYDPTARSTVAFFPAYPLAARAVAAALGCDMVTALLLTSNCAFLASLVVLARYCAVRRAGPAEPTWALWALAACPATLFFRMAYAESLLVLTSLLVLYGVARRWPLLPLALCAGLASATRPVGIAVSAAFLWHAIRRPGPWAIRLGRVALFGPVACWGLAAYMAYQAAAFGDPLAFARTQTHWTYRAPVEQPGPGEKARALARLEPIRGVYDPESGRYWGRTGGADNLLFNFSFWNPLLFGLAAGLVALGTACRWLTGPEAVFGAVALGVPYLTRAYEMSMASHGRFAAVVIPAALVAGRLLASLPPAATAGATAASSALLALWTALYVAGYSFF